MEVIFVHPAVVLHKVFVRRTVIRFNLNNKR